MNAEQFRELQAPHKARYKEDPAAGIQTLRAEGVVSQGNVSCKIVGGKPGAASGLHPSAGGDGSFACSAEVLLESLVGCAGVTLAAVATAMTIEFKSALVVAEGVLDFSGTLGVSRSATVGFSKIRLSFAVDTNAPAEKVQKLVELAERYCVVFQTLVKPPAIEVQVLARSPIIAHP